MSCQKFDEETLKMYVQGKLEKYSRIVLAIKVHLTKCTRCRKRVAELKKKKKRAKKFFKPQLKQRMSLELKLRKKREKYKEGKRGSGRGKGR
ncbi:MAG: hypothetical protein V1768_02125 [Patescibacteria group bacterium]